MQTFQRSHGHGQTHAPHYNVHPESTGSERCEWMESEGACVWGSVTSLHRGHGLGPLTVERIHDAAAWVLSANRVRNLWRDRLAFRYSVKATRSEFSPAAARILDESSSVIYGIGEWNWG